LLTHSITHTRPHSPTLAHSNILQSPASVYPKKKKKKGERWSPSVLPSARDECEHKFSPQEFTEQLPVCPSQHTTGQSKAESSVLCYSNTILQAAYCEIKNMVVDPRQIAVVRGGEPVLSVLGRAEELEFPVFSPGAFQVSGCTWNESALVNPGMRYHIPDILRKGFSVSATASTCSQTIEEPTLFVLRYEYANLYHTVTDWHAIWATLHAAGLLQQSSRSVDGARITRPLTHRIVLLDGHAEGTLDPILATLFTPDIMRIKDVAPGTCFSRALLVHAGYTSPLYDWPDTCGVQPTIRDFAAFVTDRHGLADQARSSPTPVLFVHRDAYVAHPRNPSGSAGRLLSNPDEVERTLMQASKGAGHALHPVNMSFTAQLAAVRASGVLVGMHGAALTHVLFMRSGAVLAEIQPPSHAFFTHFEKFARWTGARYVQQILMQPDNTTYEIPSQVLADVITASLQPNPPPASLPADAPMELAAGALPLMHVVPGVGERATSLPSARAGPGGVFVPADPANAAGFAPNGGAAAPLFAGAAIVGNEVAVAGIAGQIINNPLPAAASNVVPPAPERAKAQT
jgi:hypothetical protein